MVLRCKSLSRPFSDGSKLGHSPDVGSMSSLPRKQTKHVPLADFVRRPRNGDKCLLRERELAGTEHGGRR